MNQHHFFHLRKWSIWHDSACCHTCCLSVTEKLSNVQPVWSGCDTGIAFQRGGWSWKLLEQTKRTEERTRKIPAQPTHFVTLGSSSQQLCRFNQSFLWNSSYTMGRFCKVVSPFSQSRASTSSFCSFFTLQFPFLLWAKCSPRNCWAAVGEVLQQVGKGAWHHFESLLLILT